MSNTDNTKSKKKTKKSLIEEDTVSETEKSEISSPAALPAENKEAGGEVLEIPENTIQTSASEEILEIPETKIGKAKIRKSVSKKSAGKTALEKESARKKLTVNKSDEKIVKTKKNTDKKIVKQSGGKTTKQSPASKIFESKSAADEETEVKNSLNLKADNSIEEISAAEISADHQEKKGENTKAENEIDSSKKFLLEKLHGSESEVQKTINQESKTLSLTENESPQLEIFQALENPVLPKITAENRAYLQMQSPTKVFFYWSVKEDSAEKLFRALGNRAADYRMAIKLINLTDNSERILPAQSGGSQWFDVEADSNYRAEVGFYAPHRPFVRIVFSNVLQTPRSAPSPNIDYQPYFAVTPVQFAEVLDSAGYSQDAFEIFITGDDPEISDQATRLAVQEISGETAVDFSKKLLGELRYALFALASGITLSALHDNISQNTLDFLEGLTKNDANVLSEENVILSLENFFGFSPVFEEIEVETKTFTPSFAGASLVNFGGKPLTKVRLSPMSKKFFERNLNPMSSFVVR